VIDRRSLLAMGAVAAAGGCASDTAASARGADVLRIGVASCAHQDRPQPIWDAARGDALDAFVFAGDNVYGDAVPFDRAVLRAAYDTLAAKPEFERLRASLPHAAVWDDHDYGVNDGGADFPHKQAAKDEFLRFWRVPADDPRRARDGLHTVQWFERGAGRRVQLIVLDTRWFRSPLKRTDARGAPGRERYLPDDDPAKTMLGAAQWPWLEERLREPADVRLLVSSVQCVVDGHGWERWGNLPAERERLYRLIRATGARGIVVLSGDRHIGAIYREASALLPQPLYELTSSGVTHPSSRIDEATPKRIGALVNALHYGVVEIDFAARRLTLSLRGVDRRVLREHAVAFDELRIEARA
jgi:alkaline phosphatase D